MIFNNIKFDAIVTTPACGKSYLCDKYPNIFVDVDEVRLRCKFIVPENITRAELEATKGNRSFDRRFQKNEYIQLMNQKLDEFVKMGRILLCYPHPEIIDYLIQNNIRFCFVYANKDMKQELEIRLRKRNNPESTIQTTLKNFDLFYQQDIQDYKSVLRYEFGPTEYLEDILKKFGCQFCDL